MRTGEVLAVVAEGVDGGVVDAGLDAVFFHIILEAATAMSLGEEDGADVAGGDTWMIREGDGEFCGEMCTVVGDNFTAALVVGGEFLELLDAQGGTDFVDAVVVSQLDYVIGVGVPGVTVVGQGGHAMRAQEFEFGSNLVGVGGEHTALARCQVFIREEAEAADLSPGAKRFAIQGRTRAMGSVFDHVQVVLSGDLEDGGHVAGVAGIMHDDDGFGARSDAGCDRSRRDGKVVRAGDVGEDHAGTSVEHGVGGGDEGQGGDDDLVSRSDAECHTGKVEGFGGVGDAQTVGGGGHHREVVFEVACHFTHC